MLQTFRDHAIQILNIDPQVVLEAEQLARKHNILLAHCLIRMKAGDPNKILGAWAAAFHLKIANLDSMEIQPEIIRLLPPQLAKQARAIPIDKVGNNIIIAIENPHDLNAINLIQLKTGFLLKPVLASEESIAKALSKYYEHGGIDIDKFSRNSTTQQRGRSGDQRIVINESTQNNQDAPITALVDNVLQACVQRGASDIHVEPYENYLRIRLRIDGYLTEIAQAPGSMIPSIVSRFKVMSGMKIEEKRLPQDGNINVFINNRPIDFRINTMPTVHGEKVVLRILDRSSLQVDMTKLGFQQDDLDKFKKAISNPFGMVLVTGPTGSGKTTTLYSALAELNKTSDNIVTAEEPVEYMLDGINQLQIRPDIGLTFSEALRSFLRQDPDIIMVGEIRDKDTGEIAIKAALTGHMVLSTLHTNSAADTIVRLQNMGLESFNIISALQAIVAQRLTRKICENCRVPDQSLKAEHLVSLGVPPNLAKSSQVFKGKGCHVCGESGYKGRVAVHEVMIINDELRAAIMKQEPAMILKKVAIKNNMRTLRQNALIKMLAGEIDALEVISVTTSDD